MPKLLSFSGRWWLMPASTVSRAIKSSSARGLLESSIHWYAINTDLRSPRRSPLWRPLSPVQSRPTSSRCNFRLAMNYNPSTQTLLLYWSLGSILVTGPKAEAFFERFSEHRVALVMVDGKDILRVVMSLRQGKAKSELGCPCPLDFSVQRENRENWKNRMRCTLMTCNARPSVLEGGR